MIDGRKVVVVTPAGRRRYLEILIPYILRDRNIIDEYHLWINTVDEDDIAYMEQLASTFPDFIKLIRLDPDTPINMAMKGFSIHHFFRRCTEPGTVYVRVDDDVLFADEGAFERLIRFRIQNPQYFLVYGNIVNNAITSHLHQRFGVIDQQRGTAGYHCMDQIGWEDPKFAEYCHRWFFHHYQEGSLDKYKAFERWELNVFERVSINVISWLGEEFLAFGGEVDKEEEWWLSQVKPQELNKMNCMVGDALFAHYAFYVQREYLETTNVLALYKQVCDLETKDLDDAERLLYSLNVILSAPINKLKEVHFLEHMIRMAGLQPDAREPYDQDAADYVGHSSGSWQSPRQLAELMVYLQEHRIGSYLDVGAFNGWTCSLLTAVLWRFNPELQVTAIDTQGWWTMHPQIGSILPIKYRLETSDSHRGARYDFVFIDGNPEYSAVLRDYKNVGERAKVCALANCNDGQAGQTAPLMGGAPKAWSEIKDDRKVHEFFGSEQGSTMGIGVVSD